MEGSLERRGDEGQRGDLKLSHYTGVDTLVVTMTSRRKFSCPTQGNEDGVRANFPSSPCYQMC
jgi:hypothetical protein